MPLIANSKYYYIKANGKYYDIYIPPKPILFKCYTGVIVAPTYHFYVGVSQTVGDYPYMYTDDATIYATDSSQLSLNQISTIVSVSDSQLVMTFYAGTVTIDRDSSHDLYT